MSLRIPSIVAPGQRPFCAARWRPVLRAPIHPPLSRLPPPAPRIKRPSEQAAHSPRRRVPLSLAKPLLRARLSRDTQFTKRAGVSDKLLRPGRRTKPPLSCPFGDTSRACGLGRGLSGRGGAGAGAGLVGRAVSSLSYHFVSRGDLSVGGAQSLFQNLPSPSCRHSKPEAPRNTYPTTVAPTGAHPPHPSPNRCALVIPGHFFFFFF